MVLKTKIAKLAMLAAVSTAAGLMLGSVNVKADTTANNNQSAIQQQVNSTSNYTQNNVQLYSNNLAQAQTQAASAAAVSVQNINIPAGYTLDAVKNVQNSEQANELEKTSVNGVYNNNYQQDPSAEQETVDISNLTPEQTIQMNQYALNLVNQVRYELKAQPLFTQNQDSVNTVEGMANQYQEKGKSLLKGDWHDEDILQGHAENISAFQIYIDNVSGLRARPFDEALGRDFVNTDSVPLFSVNNMDDLQAMIYYGVTLMLFKDADDNFGHAQNFLTNYQPIDRMSVYPSLTEGTGKGYYSDGTPLTYKLLNVDMHFIWAGANQTGANQPSDNNVTGWRISSDGNHYVYYKDNQPLTGRQYISLSTINGVGTSWYLVDNGVVQSGVQKWAGTYYYFNPQNYLRVDNDYVQSQWGDWYLFGNDGRILTGVQKWAGSYYYFDPVTYLKVTNDYRQSQWGDWYLFGNDGRILTGVQKWAGSYYYFDPVTYLKVTNDYRQSQWGDWYLFGNDGRILTGVQKWAGSYYYFDPVTYLKITNSYRQSQWGDWYMFGPDGRIVSGLYNWLGNLYYFDPVTYLKVTNQYVYVGGVRYWADANGCLSRA